MGIAWIVGVTVLLWGCTGRIIDTPLTYRLGKQGIIPDGFKTYTLFMSTSTESSDRSSTDKLRALERNFKRFGDLIGQRNLAVWVNEGTTLELSVSRGVYYADLFSRWSGHSIEYSDGPFIVVANAHPKVFSTAEYRTTVEASQPTAIVIGFRNISPDHIIDVLNLLEARIRRETVDPSEITIQILWIKVKSWWEEGADKELVKELFKKITIALISRGG